MTDDKITLDMIQEAGKEVFCTYGDLRGYCILHSSCDECNKKIRFYCKIKEKIENRQLEIIKKKFT